MITEHEADEDLQSLEHLALRCEQFSSLVGIEGVTGKSSEAQKRSAKKNSQQHPSSILMDVGNTAELLGGEQPLCKRIVRAFQQRDCLVRIGLADTIGAAWALAHCEAVDSTHGFRIPHIEIAPPGKHLQRLEPLPIESLRLPEETVELLQQLGVTSVEQLLELPRSGLRSRFGEAVLHRLDQAAGTTGEVIQTYRPVAPLEVSYSLEHSTSRRDTIEQLILRLLTDLSVRLKEQNRGVMQLESELTSAERRTVTIQVGLFRPTTDVQHLFELTCMQLERKTMTAPIQELVVRATLTSRMMDAQHSLLEQCNSQVPEQLAHLVEKLSSRLGRDRVVTTRLLAEPQPEHNYRYEPLAGQKNRDRGGTPAALRKNAQTAGLRPMRLYPQPIPLRTIELASDQEQQGRQRSWVAHPAAFHHRGHHHQVLNAWGRRGLKLAGGEGLPFVATTIAWKMKPVVATGYFAIWNKVSGSCMASLNDWHDCSRFTCHAENALVFQVHASTSAAQSRFRVISRWRITNRLGLVTSRIVTSKIMVRKSGSDRPTPGSFKDGSTRKRDDKAEEERDGSNTKNLRQTWHD